MAQDVNKKLEKIILSDDELKNIFGGVLSESELTEEQLEEIRQASRDYCGMRTTASACNSLYPICYMTHYGCAPLAGLPYLRDNE